MIFDNLFFFLFHFFSFSGTHSFSLFSISIYVYNAVLFWSHKWKFHQFTWQVMYIYLFSPTWTTTYPICMFPYSMAKGQINNEGLGFNQLKTSESCNAPKMSWFLKNLRANSSSIVLMNWQLIIEDSASFGSSGLAITRSSHKVGFLWSSSVRSLQKCALILSMLSYNSTQLLNLT